jgi:Tfp pilus assembly protein PilZ
MAEKRYLKRYLKRLKVRYGLEQAVKLAFTEDISTTGIFIRTYDVLKPGSVILVEIYLPDDTKIMFKGRVMWEKKLPPALVGQVKKTGMGIKIVEFLSDGESVWKKCIESCADIQKAGECNAAGSQDMHDTLNMPLG